jgi:DNA end-binding protein Ku
MPKASALEAVIKKRLKDWSPEMVSDPIQESLLKLVAEKKKAKKPSKAKAAKSSKDNDDEKSNVLNIMDALKKSVAKELKSRKAG